MKPEEPDTRDASTTDATEPAAEPAAEAGAADAAAPDQTAKPSAPDQTAKPSKADRLVARAERLREQEAQRSAARAARDAAPATRPTRWIVAVVLLSVLTLALAAVVVIGAVDLHRRNAVDDARSAALKAARSGALSFGAYDYRHLDSDIAKTATLLTPSFAKEYRRTTSALAQTFTAYKSVSTATVPSAGVVSASTGHATVLVLVDQVIRSTQSTVPKINRNRLTIRLTHTGGKWLIDRIDAT